MKLGWKINELRSSSSSSISPREQGKQDWEDNTPLLLL
jgi:hypothetical protein